MGRKNRSHVKYITIYDTKESAYKRYELDSFGRLKEGANKKFEFVFLFPKIELNDKKESNSCYPLTPKFKMKQEKYFHTQTQVK